MSNGANSGFQIADCGLMKKTKTRNPKSAIRNETGFTLIEVLLAMAILAVIMAAVYGSFSTAGRNVEQAEAARDEADLARTLLSKLTDDLANAYFNPNMTATDPATNKPVNLTILYGKKEEVEEGGEKTRHDSLALTTLTNWRRPDSQETELLEVGYFFREKADGSGYSFFRREKRELRPDIPPLEGGVEYELTDRVAGLQFRYSSGTNSADEWDTRLSGAGGLPKVVEITLILDSGKAYVTRVDVVKQ
jgi:prepilin-type N-terminal cleavage/methylation domain-containing protein